MICKACKRCLDIFLAFGLLVITLPLCSAIWLLIRLTSSGPALFRQERAGLHGKPFTLYKFRTMKLNVDPYGPSPHDDSDPRLTRIGKWLRETSLDELPQLFNVLKGDMSIVGPRPLYVSQINEWNNTQKQRLLVKPGLTGLAQVHARGAATREEKLALDVSYVQTRSLRLDAIIIIRTIITVFHRRNIYEKQYAQNETHRRQR